MATNSATGRNMVAQVKSMISDNNFDITICVHYLTLIESDLGDALKAYKSVVVERDGF